MLGPGAGLEKAPRSLPPPPSDSSACSLCPLRWSGRRRVLDRSAEVVFGRIWRARQGGAGSVVESGPHQGQTRG
eukprot:2461516-Pyramimonas_sp.AAC.1